MKILYGNLIHLAKQGRFDVIVHGCNCFHTMGAGIAKAIKEAFPVAYQADLVTPYGDYRKLGTYSFAYYDTYRIFVLNAYTQFDFRGKDKPKVDYQAIRDVFKKINSDFSGKRVGYPKIGAGLAGGDWSIISRIIEEELTNCDHTLVLLK